MAEKLNATVVDMRFVKPIDEARILEVANTHDIIVTLEENAIQGGAGSAVSEVLNSHGKTTALLQLGLPDIFIPQGTQQEALAEINLDEKGLKSKIVAFIKVKFVHFGLILIFLKKFSKISNYFKNRQSYTLLVHCILQLSF